MAHFAQLDENNVVMQVIVIADKDTADDKGKEKEEIGVAFCKSLFGENTKWVQTSFNHNKRGHYAGVGDIYDAQTDMFITQTRGEIVDAKNFIDAEVVEPTKAIEGGN